MTQGNTPHFAAYERIAELTAAMLAAARESQWEELIVLENECKTVFASLVETAQAPLATPEQMRRKAALIQQVLADDAEIRKLVEPWVAELGQWLGSSSRSNRLQDTYSASR